MVDVVGPAYSSPAGSVPSSPRMAGDLPPLDPSFLSILPLPGGGFGSEPRNFQALTAFLCSIGYPLQEVNRVLSSVGSKGGDAAPVPVPPFPPVVSGSSSPVSPALVVDSSPAAGQSDLGICAQKFSAGGGVGPSEMGFSNLNSTALFPPSAVAGPLFSDQDFPALSPAPALFPAERGLLSSHPPSLVGAPPAPLSSGLSTVLPSVHFPLSGVSPVVGRHSPAWSTVVGETSQPDRSLSFFPPAPSDGDVIIKPPVDLLRKGNSLWATSLIGGFLHSRLPFKQVESFALKVWGGLGLQKVFLHTKGYFIFKFSSAAARDNVLALGPWYLSNKLLLLSHWKEGADPLQESPTKVPVWVKLHSVPYAYWTSEGLSYLASGIGKPLFMDTMTAKLEPLPFARVCIEISAGSKLPDKLFATILDADSGEESLIEVQVSYQSKPKACGFCSSFGHPKLKCPRANYQWVQKVSDPSSSDGVDLVSPDGSSPTVPPMVSAVLPQGSLPKAFPQDPLPKAFPKGFLSKARPKVDPPKALPRGAIPKGCPKGDLPKSCLKGGPPKDLPTPQQVPPRDFCSSEGSSSGLPEEDTRRGLPEKASRRGLPEEASRRGLPEEDSRRGFPEEASRRGLPEEVSLIGSFPLAESLLPPISPNPFSVLAPDRDTDPTGDSDIDSPESEPPSWGPLVRRLKAIDEKESRALLCEDIGPPIRAQSKQRKKKKSPKGK